MKDLYEYINPRTGKKAPLLSDEVYKIIEKMQTKSIPTLFTIEILHDFFGFKTLERSYLLKLKVGLLSVLNTC